MKSGGILTISGLGLLLFGLFAITRARPCDPGSCGIDLNAIAYTLGLGLLALAVARFLWTGWHGTALAWLVGAPVAAILVWTLYELIRQAMPAPGIGILGEMTAPTVSVAVGGSVLLVGWIRHSRASSGVLHGN
jgi:hypothetical protein